ncbi:hypothetical protein ARMGADRAFT_342577 [Armillaria gallica]|uniref:Uncharacterized protein n=1 Tax=Armillaria gallica TaxID=47427 RepID=A0A2H3D6M6_ARMGA|nr:hypothetical protein ARMGADRAFT_342577 [Armillaria gallica]
MFRRWSQLYWIQALGIFLPGSPYNNTSHQNTVTQRGQSGASLDSTDLACSPGCVWIWFLLTLQRKQMGQALSTR